MSDKIKALHQCWCITTGQELNLMATERIWYELAKLNFTDSDLLCVLKHVLAYNRSHSGCPMKIQAHKICGDIEVFASICSEARAKQRNAIPKATQKEVILNQLRGVTPESNGNCRPISEVFEAMRKATS